MVFLGFLSRGQSSPRSSSSCHPLVVNSLCSVISSSTVWMRSLRRLGGLYDVCFIGVEIIEYLINPYAVIAEYAAIAFTYAWEWEILVLACVGAYAVCEVDV